MLLLHYKFEILGGRIRQDCSANGWLLDRNEESFPSSVSFRFKNKHCCIHNARVTIRLMASIRFNLGLSLKLKFVRKNCYRFDLVVHDLVDNFLEFGFELFG